LEEVKPSDSQITVSTSVLYQLAAAQSMLYVFSRGQSLCDFIAKNLQAVPGLGGVTVCLHDKSSSFISRLQLDACSNCPVKEQRELPENFTCPLMDSDSVELFPMETDTHFFGIVALVEEKAEFFSGYKSLVQNLISSVTLTLENLLQRRQLEDRENHLEQLVQKRTQELEKALEEKRLLLREVHHRVKNNLSVIISLLHMQKNTVGEKGARSALEESASRVATMQEIHQFLYQSEQYSYILSDQFFPELLSSLTLSYSGTREGRIQLKQEIDSIRVPVDSAVPSSLIVNELITNSLKHGYSDATAKGTVVFPFREKSPRHILLEVRDDGSGIAGEIDYTRSETLGLKLIFALTRQLGGTIEVDSGEWGTSVAIEFTLRDEQ
jgi:two-component sensor histidine kinase